MIVIKSKHTLEIFLRVMWFQKSWNINMPLVFLEVPGTFFWRFCATFDKYCTTVCLYIMHYLYKSAMVIMTVHWNVSDASGCCALFFFLIFISCYVSIFCVRKLCNMNGAIILDLYLLNLLSNSYRGLG